MTTAKFEKLGHKYVSQFARDSFRAFISFQFAKTKKTKTIVINHVYAHREVH